MAPVVSVGIPTFNRPERLDARLANVLSQDTAGMEVIVSDNASPNPAVEEIARGWAARDSRVRYVRQSENIGAGANFRLVLSEATGEFFIWAADDDRWDDDLLPFAMDGIGNAALFAPVTYVAQDGVAAERVPLPKLRGDDRYGDAVRFLRNAQPSMVYGLYRRRPLTAAMGRIPTDFDMWDIALLFGIICNGGIVAAEDGPAYFAGVPATGYVPKPISSGVFSYRGLAASMVMTAWKFPGSAQQKASLSLKAIRYVTDLAAHLTEAYPSASRPYHRAARLLAWPSNYWDAHFGRN